MNRFFNAPATACLIGFDRQGVTKGVYRLRSPLMYDNVKGIHIAASGGQTIFDLPAVGVQPFYSQDTLILEGTGETGAYDLVTMTRYYSNFQGSDMRLYSWGTIAPLIVNLYEIEVATTSTATPVAWTDTVVTTTENLLKANTDHAVLGYTVDVALGGIAIKGADTSNFRYGGPGLSNSPFTADYLLSHRRADGSGGHPGDQLGQRGQHLRVDHRHRRRHVSQRDTASRPAGPEPELTMTVLGKITVVLSDDPRYEAGKSYDVLLSTPQTPAPAEPLTGTMDEVPETTEASAPEGA